MVQLILGGQTSAAPQLYSLTADGAVMDESEYTFSGSGSVIANRIASLRQLRKDMPVDECIRLAVRAIRLQEKGMFTQRKEITVLTITKDWHKMGAE